MVVAVNIWDKTLLTSVHTLVALLFDLLLTILALTTARVFMILVYDIIRKRHKSNKKSKNVLVYGVGSKSVAQIKRLQNSESYNIVGFLNNGMKMKGHTISSQ